MPRHALEQAYLRTRYVVDHPCGEIVLRIGRRSARLDALLCEAHCDSWAFVSACNPASRRLSAAENAARHAALLAQVKGLGKPVFSGRGEADDGDWCEPSILVVGMAEAGAVALGRAFGQNAVVVGRAGAAAELRWCVE
jgi:hypothetical protein